jgi:hypothetical protein
MEQVLLVHETTTAGSTAVALQLAVFYGELVIVRDLLTLLNIHSKQGVRQVSVSYPCGEYCLLFCTWMSLAAMMMMCFSSGPLCPGAGAEITLA